MFRAGLVAACAIAAVATVGRGCVRLRTSATRPADRAVATPPVGNPADVDRFDPSAETGLAGPAFAGAPLSRPLDLIADAGGAALVWTRETEDRQTDVFYLPLDSSGRAAGPRVRLATESQHFLRVRAVRAAGRIAIGWCGRDRQNASVAGMMWVWSAGEPPRMSAGGVGIADVTDPLGAARAPAPMDRAPGCDLELVADDPELVVLVPHGWYRCWDVIAGRGGFSSGCEAIDASWPLDRSARVPESLLAPLAVARTSTNLVVALDRGPGGASGTLLYAQPRGPSVFRAAVARGARVTENPPRGPRPTDCRYYACGAAAGALHGAARAGLAWTGDRLVALAPSDPATAAASPEHDSGAARVVSQRIECRHDRPWLVWTLATGERVDVDPADPGVSLRWTDVLAISDVAAAASPLAAAWTGQTLLVVRAARGDAPPREAFALEALACRDGTLRPLPRPSPPGFTRAR
jgi:hypothetical protein